MNCQKFITVNFVRFGQNNTSFCARKTDEGRYGVLGYGGGAPIGYGLEKSDITLEDILNGN